MLKICTNFPQIETVLSCIISRTSLIFKLKLGFVTMIINFKILIDFKSFNAKEKRLDTDSRALQHRAVSFYPQSSSAKE